MRVFPFFGIHFLLLHLSARSLSLYACLYVCHKPQFFSEHLTSKGEITQVQVGGSLFFSMNLMMCENKISPVRHYIVNPFFPVRGKWLQMMIDKHCYLFRAVNVHCDVRPSVSIY